MAQNITLLGASYSAVPAVQIPKTGGGTATFWDPEEIFPVGSLWASEDSTDNPATVLGFGTWARVSTDPTWDEIGQNWDQVDGIIVSGVYVWKRTA